MRYLITGGSGYIGGRLIESLLARDDVERIVICDVRPPKTFRPRTEFREVDVRDAKAVRDLVGEERPDVLVHLAFLLNPIHDEQAMYDIDVNGTHNVLEAASAAGVQQVLVTSSAVAYGAFPDNPVPITEDHPVRGVAGFEYARDKTESDRLCQLWALRHPDRTMTIVRPCIVFGPNADNYLVRLWTGVPFVADFGGADHGVQFVHEDDVVSAIELLMEGAHGGAFNIAPDDTMSTADAARLAGLKVRRVPPRLYTRFVALMWRLRQSEAPPGSIAFAVHPWIASNAKLRSLGWEPRHTSRDAFEITMRARGKLSGDGSEAVQPSASPPVAA